MNKNTPSVHNSDYPRVTLTEFRGVLFLHLGTDWIQGAMRLGKPNEIVLDYVQQMMIWMLFKNRPSHIVQLGLGSAALTKFCYHHFSESRITAIELNPEVIRICRNTFHLPEDNHRLTVLQADARNYIEAKKYRNEIDILQIDLYDEQAAAPLFDTLEFYKSCADVLTGDGILTLNIFGNESNRSKSIEALQACFDSVAWLPEVDGGNVIVIAFKESPSIGFEDLYRRAQTIRRKTKLKSERWVEGLYEWMRGS
jgi:spermidine synthase